MDVQFLGTPTQPYDPNLQEQPQQPSHSWNSRSWNLPEGRASPQQQLEQSILPSQIPSETFVGIPHPAKRAKVESALDASFSNRYAAASLTSGNRGPQQPASSSLVQQPFTQPDKGTRNDPQPNLLNLQPSQWHTAPPAPSVVPPFLVQTASAHQHEEDRGATARGTRPSEVGGREEFTARPRFTPLSSTFSAPGDSAPPDASRNPSLTKRSRKRKQPEVPLSPDAIHAQLSSMDSVFAIHLCTHISESTLEPLTTMLKNIAVHESELKVKQSPWRGNAQALVDLLQEVVRSQINMLRTAD